MFGTLGITGTTEGGGGVVGGEGTIDGRTTRPVSFSEREWVGKFLNRLAFEWLTEVI